MSSFSISRLGKLITKQFFENSRLYTFSVLALLGLIALTFAFWIFATGPDYHEEATYIIFILGLFIAGCIFASMSFNVLGSRDKGIYWLGIPATHLEKLLCTIFFSTIMFTLVYCICFFLVKWLAVSFLTEFVKADQRRTYTTIKNFGDGPSTAIRYFICGYFAMQSLYLLGSVYFTRYSFVITTVITALLIFGFGYYVSSLEDIILGPGSWDLVSVKKYNAGDNAGYNVYSISETMANVIRYAIQFSLPPLFWIVTWFRLKEKEI